VISSCEDSLRLQQNSDKLLDLLRISKRLPKGTPKRPQAISFVRFSCVIDGCLAFSAQIFPPCAFFDDEIADGGAEPFVAKHKHNLSLL